MSPYRPREITVSEPRGGFAIKRTGSAETAQSTPTDDDVAFLTLVYPAAGALDNVGSINGTVTLAAGKPVILCARCFAVAGR